MSDIRYSYLHGAHRHVTIAREADFEEGWVHIGIAVSHPSDSFDRKRGRSMAMGRLQASRKDLERDPLDQKGVAHAHRVSLDKEGKPFETVMEFLSRTKEVPACVKQLAQNWRREQGV